VSGGVVAVANARTRPIAETAAAPASILPTARVGRAKCTVEMTPTKSRAGVRNHLRRWESQLLDPSTN
jgi:hypothetical protein